MKDPEICQTFQQTLEQYLNTNISNPFDLESQWAGLKTTVLSAAEREAGFSSCKHQDCFDKNNDEICKLISIKNSARLFLENGPQFKTEVDNYRHVMADVKTQIRRIQNDLWRTKANENQCYADQDRVPDFYSTVHATYGPVKTIPMPVKTEDGSILTDGKEISILQTEVCNLLNRPSTASEDCLFDLPTLPKKTWMSAPPTLKELGIASYQGRDNKAPGPDSIPAEHCTRMGEMILQIWE